jgi:inactivated superfamily I helicase
MDEMTRAERDAFERGVMAGIRETARRIEAASHDEIHKGRDQVVLEWAAGLARAPLVNSGLLREAMRRASEDSYGG